MLAQPATITDANAIQLIMDRSTSLVFVKDEDSTILYGNRAFLELFPPEWRGDVIGAKAYRGLPADAVARMLEADRQALATGEASFVQEFTLSNGARRVFFVRKLGFRDESGAARIVVVSSDITELADRERELAQLNEQLQIFTALAAHDLRSPLATLVSILHLIERDKGTVLSPTAQGYVRSMVATITSLSTNIASLLIASKAVRTPESLVFAPCDLQALVDDLRFALHAQIQGSGAVLEVERLPTLTVESTLFRQLLQNLIENSIKYRSEGKHLVVRVAYERRPDTHVLSVTDNGRGIAADAAERAFGIYEQEAARGVQGVGLGLALCKRVAELHGGTISIDRTAVVGCRIVVELPADPRDGAGPTDASTVPSEALRS